MDFLHTKKRKKYYAKVIEIYKKTGYGADKISKSGLVPLDRGTIRAWIVNFEKENGIIHPQNSKTSPMKNKKEDDLELLKAEISALKKELEMEHLRNRLNEKIIEIAEKKYKIQIRKKAGAKQ